MAKKTENKVSENTVVVVNTDIGDLEITPELKLGAKVLTKIKHKAFFVNNKLWYVDKDNVIHMYI